MNQKKCKDCGKQFNPKSNRSIRCSSCQKTARKKQQNTYVKKMRSRRAVDGRAIIKPGGNLEPLSHRSHEKMSNFIVILAQIAGPEEFERLFPGIKNEIKYEQLNQKVYKSYKKGIPQWKILKEHNIPKSYYDNIIREMKGRESIGDNVNRIQESRTRITLLNDWLKIFHQYEKDDKWEIERNLDSLLEDVALTQLFEYEKFTFASSDVRSRTVLDQKTFDKIQLVVDSVDKFRQELLEENHPEDIPKALWTPISHLIKYRSKN